MTDVRCPVNEAADTSRNEPALIMGSRKIIYSEYDQYVAATAERLQEAGCREGDRVGIVMPNHWGYAVLVMALFRVKAVACPMNTRLPPGEVKRLLDALACVKLIAPPGTPGASGLPADRIWDSEDLVTFFRREPHPASRAVLSLDQPATVLMTAGRAGEAKAVLLSYGNHYYSARGANTNIRASSGSRWLLSGPLCRASGMSLLISSALGGASVAIPGAHEALPSAILQYGVTHLLLSPAELARLLRGNLDPEGYRTLHAILVADGPAPHDLLDRARARQLPVCTSYGLTEMAFQVTAMPPAAPPDKRDTSGTALKYRELRIADDGEILVRGPTLFSGYLEDGQIRRPVDAEGWFPTGDVGRIDGDGYLTVVGLKGTGARRGR
ncbi:MAG: AMP-binding protein [Verrucomicrobiota bacterium]